MYKSKYATIYQVILLLAALVWSIFSWIAFAIVVGLQGVEYFRIFTYAYGYLAAFIIIMLTVKLILTLILKFFSKKENWILPIGGIVVFVILLVLRLAVYYQNGWSVDLIMVEIIYFYMLMFLLINSIVIIRYNNRNENGKKITFNSPGDGSIGL